MRTCGLWRFVRGAKKAFLRTGARNNSGIILIIVLWIMVILTLLAVSLGHRAGVALTLANYSVGKVRSKYMAMAGIVYALEQIRKDSGDAEASQRDTRSQCGFILAEGETPEDLFRHVKVGDGYFDIRYFVADAQEHPSPVYGPDGEEGKINLNGLLAGNYKVLSQLIVLMGFEESVGDTIAAAAVDWHDADDVPLSPLGAEKDYYASLQPAYPCKNKPFESVAEILLVKGMTPEIFAKIKNDITVFPSMGFLQINFDLASEAVLRARARSVAGPQTNATADDADSLTEKLVAFRDGPDGKPGTSDDRPIDAHEISLNAKEAAIWQTISGQGTKVSNYLTVNVRGVDPLSHATTEIEAVVVRKDLSIVSWRRK